MMEELDEDELKYGDWNYIKQSHENSIRQQREQMGGDRAIEVFKAKNFCMIFGTKPASMVDLET